MQILKSIVFLGPNRWSLLPVLEAFVEFPASPPNQPETLSKLTRQLHQTAGVSTRWIAPEAADAPNRFLLPFEFEEESLLRECLATAMRLIENAMGATTDELEVTAIDSASEHRRLIDLADTERLGPSSRAILSAATARGIPYYRLNQGSLVQLGEGIFQRRIWTAETDATSAIAESIASDKQLTRAMLAAVGVNVPKGRSVVDREDAWRAAQEIGLPVVVKPRNGNHSCGVRLDLNEREAILSAYDWACDSGATTDVLVEQYIRGNHHRVLVIGGKFVAASKAEREYVIGDGVRTIRELIEELNLDPRRGENYTDYLDFVALNESTAIVLNQQGLNFESVPEKNKEILVSHLGDLTEDCTDRVHPVTQAAAVLAAKTIGLDIAGMDLVASDISVPLSDQCGCFVEVNAGPSLSSHVAPLIGSPQPVGEAVIDLLFPDSHPAKIPTILLMNGSDANPLANELAREFASIQYKVGIASHCRPTTIDSPTWPIVCELHDYRSLLMHPLLSAVMLECSAQIVAEKGVDCLHAEFVILPHEWFTTLNSMSASVRATLQTLHHLLEYHGKVIVYGSEKIDSQSVAQALNLPLSRIQISADQEQAIRIVCDGVERNSV
ncbi:MAG: ATP-grasp domain-containing protein [Pirellulaceae bacterium]|nr:ATP-grasp domain-containing protein [Pirellulaceae bacterium]